MMKIAVRVFIALLLPTITNAQTFTFQKVMECDSMTNEQIIKRGKLWLAENIKDSRAATELIDENTIFVNSSYAPVVKGSFGAKITPGRIEFTIKIEAKDGKYRYTYDNFIHKSEDPRKVHNGGALEDDKPDGGMSGLQNKIWKQYKELVPVFVETCVKDFHRFVTDKEKSDW